MGDDWAKDLRLDSSCYAIFLQGLQTAFLYFPFVADVVRDEFVQTFHDLTETLRKPSFSLKIFFQSLFKK